MPLPIKSKCCRDFCSQGVFGIALVLALAAEPAEADILWSGDYETGNFLQWHRADDKGTAYYAGVPPHGRPAMAKGETGANMPDTYYGDGSLLEIVTNPVRQGRYAAKFTVLNSANGVEPDDCDAGGRNCDRRRTELQVQRTLPPAYNAMPYQSERWISVSHYIPADWDTGGSGFGPHVFQIKPFNDGGSIGPCFSIQIKGDGWLINHRWTDIRDFRSAIPWRQRVEYTSTFPAASGGDGGEGLRSDFPDQRASQAALANLNRGGWTDWVIHIKFDARGSGGGGQGFLTVWKRAGDEDWVEVLHIEPRKITREGETYDRGICYNSPASGSNPGGFGILAGMYMSKSQVWGLSRNRVLYNDNIKVGSASASFATMSPDGSSPAGSGTQRPRAPKLLLESTSSNRHF